MWDIFMVEVVVVVVIAVVSNSTTAGQQPSDRWMDLILEEAWHQSTFLAPVGTITTPSGFTLQPPVLCPAIHLSIQFAGRRPIFLKKDSLQLINID